MHEPKRITFEEWVAAVNGEEWGGVRPLVIKDDELAVFLASYADMLHLKPCPFPRCDTCEEAQRYWWDWCNSLSGPIRIRLQRHLKAQRIPLPRHPGDDVDLSPAQR